MGVRIEKGILWSDHVHMFVSMPPHLALSTVTQRVQGRSLRKIKMEFPDLRKRYRGSRFWVRGYFSTNPVNVTADVKLQYLELDSKRKPMASHIRGTTNVRKPKGDATWKTKAEVEKQIDVIAKTEAISRDGQISLLRFYTY